MSDREPDHEDELPADSPARGVVDDDESEDAPEPSEPA